MDKFNQIMLVLILASLGALLLFQQLVSLGLDLFIYLVLIADFLVFPTYAFKVLAKRETFYIGTMLKTKRFNKSLDWIAKHERFLNWFADLGLLLGFGAIAVDYLYGRKQPKAKRIALFIFSLAAFYVVLEVLSFIFPLFDTFFTNPFIEQYSLFLKAFFMLFGLSGVIVGVLATYSLYIIENIIAGQPVCPGVAPIIPGVQVPKVPFVVPVHAWLSFLIILVLHEGMHGVLMRKIKLKIKSTGILLIGLLPMGAFVEPDEKELVKKKPREQLRVYSPGPSSNLYASMLLPIAMALVLIFVINPATGEWIQEVKENSIDAVVINDVEETIELCGQHYDNPAFGVLEPGMQIKRIGRYQIISAGGAATALGYVLTANPGQEFQMQVLDKEGKDLNVVMAPNELGIVRFGVDEIPNPDYVVSEDYKLYSMLAAFMSSFLTWLVLLNFFIALGNFLPLDPLDGGKIAKIILLPYFGFMGMNKKDTERLIGRLMLWIVGILLLINVLPMFL